MGDPHFPANPDQVAEASVAARVAIMLTMGKTRAEIGRELNLTQSRVRTIMKSDECVATMRQITNHEKDYAKARAAARSGELIDECFRVLKAELKKNNLQAVQITLKASGVFDEVANVTNDSKLIVVMPGAQAPQSDAPINVTPTKEE